MSWPYLYGRFIVRPVNFNDIHDYLTGVFHFGCLKRNLIADYFFWEYCNAALMKSLNKGCGFMGFDLNSG